MFFFSISDIERKFFGAFVNKIWRDCQNCNLRVHRKFLSHIIFSENEFFLHFGTLSEKFPAFLKLFRRICQNCILRVHSNVLSKNIIFEEKMSNNSGHWSKNLALSLGCVVKREFYFSRKTIRGKQFTQKNFFLSFSDTERKFFGFLVL